MITHSVLLLGSVLGCALATTEAVKAAEATELPAKRTAFEWLDSRRQEWTALNRAVWQAAEVGLAEVRSAAMLAQALEVGGFEVKRGIAGMPTAFVASFGSGRPHIAILAEYDALPGMSQEPGPERKPLVEGGAGHACGHSVFGTASVAAALAVRQAMESRGLSGTIRLYGTPAEETGIGKSYMVKEGVFDDADVALHWHPADQTLTTYSLSKAVVSVKYSFSGLAAHASLSPEDGRSALDAVELMNIGANYLREHLPEDARIHYVVTDGGGQPNVVPPRAEVWYYLRADDHRSAEAMFRRMENIARGAALMTDTAATVRIDSDVHELVPNLPLSQLVQRNLELVGAPQFSEEEKAFARRTQASLVESRGVAIPDALASGVAPLAAEPDLIKASTDVGDVSWRVPTGGFRVACYTRGAPGHSWQVVACTGMSIGEKGMLVAAKVLAGAAIDLFADPKLVTAAREDFERRRAGRPYTSLVPKEQRAPAKIR